MSVERALIARAQSQVIASRARAAIETEAVKGCSPVISSRPIPLEPPFLPFVVGTAGGLSVLPVAEQPLSAAIITQLPELKRMRVWISPDHKFSWTKAELFLKMLKGCRSRVAFEIAGNCESIQMGFLLAQDDAALLDTAFRSQFESCELTSSEESPFDRYKEADWNKALLSDFYPSPPYSHLLTQPDELKISPLDAVFVALARVPSDAVGCYQILLQATAADNDWHQNVNALLDLEYNIKLLSGLTLPSRTPAQSPSGELKGMAFDSERKAHNDKPFFACAMRIGVVSAGEASREHLHRLIGVANLFQHGGRPLQAVTQDDYREVISADAIRSMFVNGLAHRHGFILNSSELCGLAHLPPAELLGRHTSVAMLETLPVTEESLLVGTPIGTSEFAGTEQTVCIPHEIRSRSTHLIARPGMGKSTLQEHMVLSDIQTGAGVAVLDPHGDLVRRLLQLIPQEHADRVIYFFPGDRSWVPLWNPLQAVPNQDISRTADDIVSAIKSIVQGWGDRLENLLRHAIYALLRVPGSSFLDVANLLRKGSKESKTLIIEIEKVLDNEITRNFWQNDFAKYNNQDLTPPQHKLSKLLMSGTVALMLSQPENRINFREIMDTGKILLIDLAELGSDIRELLGSFILSLLHISALSRSDTPIEQRKPFHIFCDEAHRFLNASFEDLIAENRKFAVSLTLAHQYLEQFNKATRDAILTAGSTVVFNVDLNDAHYLVKDLRNLVEPDDIANFGIGEAVARIGTDIVKIKTKDKLPVPALNYRQQIIDHSHQHYYKPIQTVKDQIANRGHAITSVDTSLMGETSSEKQPTGEEQFYYEEFE